MEEKLSTKKPAGKDRTSEPMFRYGLCQPVFLFCFTRHFIPEITSFPFRRLRLPA